MATKKQPQSSGKGKPVPQQKAELALPKPVAKKLAVKAPAKPAPKPVVKKPAVKAPAKPAPKPVAKKPAVKAPAKPVPKPVVNKQAAKTPQVKQTPKSVPTPKPVVTPVAPVPKPVEPKPPIKSNIKSAQTEFEAQLEFLDKREQERKMMEAAKKEISKIKDWPKFVDIQKQNLLDLRDQILDLVDGVARTTLRTHPEGSEASGSGEHQGDAGSDAYDRELALGMISKNQNGIFEIEQALLRIKKEVYGICEMSYKIIPKLRLKAIPFTRYTVECQTKVEKERGKNKSHNSRGPLGFAGGQNEFDQPISLDEDDF